MINLDVLQLFVAIADEGSIAGGARRVRLSASMASRKVAELERRLSVPLLVRSTRTLQFTAAGAILLDWAKGALISFDTLREGLSAETKELVGLLSVAASEYSSYSFLQEAMVHFKQIHPGLTFRVTIADNPLSLLDQGYDVVIHAGPPPQGSLVGRKITSYPRVLCASPQYLAVHGTPTTVADLKYHRVLHFSKATDTRWYFKVPGEREPLCQELQVVLEANSYPMLIDFARKGVGILQVAYVLIEERVIAGDLEIVLPDVQCVEHDGDPPAVWLVYPNRKLNARSRMLVNFLLEQIKRKLLRERQPNGAG